MRIFLFIFLIFFSLKSFAQKENLWSVSEQGITWTWDADLKNIVDDNIEMSGLLVAGIIHYSVDTNQYLTLERDVIFPQHRPLLKSTDKDWWIYRSYLREIYKDEVTSPKIYTNNKEIVFNKVSKIEIDGMITFHYEQAKDTELSLKRSLYPSTDQAAFYDRWTLQNEGKKDVEIQFKNQSFKKVFLTTNGEISVFNQHTNPKRTIIESGASITFGQYIQAGENKMNSPDIAFEKRIELLNSWKKNLVFSSPNKQINRLFEFSKIRGSESIFESEMGKVHSPGGGRYYGGFWANDQAEYISPFFPFLGYDIGNESAMNCYLVFLDKINEEYEPIQYAFEMGGTVPAFQLDRGDAAMIAYGASQFALFRSNKKDNDDLWELIEWCLEYCKRQLNSEGVVKSESDEMEGRIETGTANLSTSSLYYGALLHSALLAKALKKNDSIISKYEQQAKVLRININTFFGGEIEGLDTYRYFKEHENLRHWICLPLVVGIDEKKEGTIEALFNRLWSENGVHVEKNNPNPKISNIFWDRGTLYALRGTFIAGATEKSIQKLTEYTEKRLLQDRVPYAVEAYPEGDMAHLSAESGLYCRVITEGMFGIFPTSFNSFCFTPRLPKEWAHMKLENIRAFNSDFSIIILRNNTEMTAMVLKGNETVLETTFKAGDTIHVQL